MNERFDEIHTDAVTIRTETPDAFFKGLVDQALEDLGGASKPSEDSAAYLVHLLARFVRPGGVLRDVGPRPDHPLGRTLLVAIESEGPERFWMLRSTGDLALFLSGFFAESLERRRVSEVYYTSVGRTAYGQAAGCCEPRSTALLYEELSDGFLDLVALLGAVRERCSVYAERGDLLAVYEHWRRTGSARSAAILRQSGVAIGRNADDIH